MTKTHYDNLIKLKDKYSEIVKKNYNNNKNNKIVEDCLTLLDNKIETIIKPQSKVSGGQNKFKKTKKFKNKNKYKKTRKNIK